MKQPTVLLAALLALLIVGGILGCSGGGGGRVAEEVSFSRVTVADPQAAGAPPPQEMVFTDAAAWESFRQQYPGLSLPDVDFATQNVAAVFLGVRNTGGYSVRIDRITYDSEARHTRLFATERQPGPGCIVTQALTYPLDIVVFPARPGTFEWVRATDVVACR